MSLERCECDGARTRTLNEFGTRPATRVALTHYRNPPGTAFPALPNPKRDAPLKESSRDRDGSPSGLLLIRVLFRKKRVWDSPLPPLPLNTGVFPSSLRRPPRSDPPRPYLNVCPSFAASSCCRRVRCFAVRVLLSWQKLCSTSLSEASSASVDFFEVL